jgi:serine/threonine protein kinase
MLQFYLKRHLDAIRLFAAWRVFHHAPFKRSLKADHGIVDCCLIRWRAWAFGARYFSGRREGRELFIKSHRLPLLVRNEIDATARARDFVPTPSIFCSDGAGRVPFIALESIPGRTLQEILDGGKGDWAAIADAILGIVDGLDRAKIVHRDLTAANLLCGEDGTVRLLDFAHAVIDSKAVGDDVVSRKTLVWLGEDLKPNRLAWDDAYSGRELIRRLETRAARPLEAGKALEERIGRRTYRYG